MAAWIGARTLDDVVAAFAEADVALAPVYDVEQYLGDPQVIAREAVTTVEDPSLGPIKMQNMLFRLSDTPGSVRSTGPALGTHTDEILGDDLGLDAARIDELRTQGVIA